jgi:hypothetical protein
MILFNISCLLLNPAKYSIKLSISNLLEFSQNVASELWLVDKQSNKINYLFTARTSELSIVIVKESITNGSLELGRGIAGPHIFFTSSN